MNPRNNAVRDVFSHRTAEALFTEQRRGIEKFGSLTFSKEVMERMLPREILTNVLGAIEGKEKIKASYADALAGAMKDWAAALGATHFSHWFQPLTGHIAEKRDAFIDWKSADLLIEKFSGKQLIRGEPDASSFPSGGLRSTSEARGYTTWDPTSPPFLWKTGGLTVLCIPSVFFSWTGEALDMKLPLLRSDQQISQAALRLLSLLEIEAASVYSTLGCEQEFFLVDRSLALLRPDLMLGGRTLFGAPPPKGQELEDHYFGTVKERVSAYMREFEDEALLLGIPLKTFHGEVAPGQFEVAPIFEKASVAVDHNVLLMELMRKIAMRHNLVCLLHEKPFAGVNGSGKHCNWSLSTDKGMNLLDPSENPENSLLFLILLTAILHAVHRHAALLRTSIASPGNDHRLGGNEAPPVIISVYLGEELEQLLEDIERGRSFTSSKEAALDLGIPAFVEFPRDNSDRNRTSPFAFTGNKFEFRAVGAPANCAFPLSILNAIVAESLNELTSEIEKKAGKKSGMNLRERGEAALSVVRKYLKLSKPIRFIGDNYSLAWEREAKKRELPIIEKSFDSFAVLEDPKTKRVFKGILSQKELDSRFEVLSEHYIKIVNIEAKLMLEMFQTQLLPASIRYQGEVAAALVHLRTLKKRAALQEALLNKLTGLIEEAIKKMERLEAQRQRALLLPFEKKGRAFCDKVAPASLELRALVDLLETLVDDRCWPLPKYREMLHIL